MSWRRGKTSGWAAFDLEQRRKLSLELEADNDPFPSISGSILKDNIAVSEKPFVSVLLHPLNFPTLRDDAKMDQKQLLVSSPSTSTIPAQLVNEIIEKKSAIKADEMLKESHPWADESLIMDVLSGVHDDVDKASTLLKAMVYSEQNYEENKDSEAKELKSISEESLRDEDKLPANINSDLAELSCLLEKSFKCNNEESPHNHDSYLKMILSSLKDIPVEPEWEEDDVYLVHRKEALRMIRSASRHSKAANDAYLRGDHLSAQQYSLKAREEWMVAKTLNATAAKEILSIRNSKNDQWTLDLHGLHVVEAVKALQEHLWKIESQLSMNQLACVDGVKKRSEGTLTARSDSASHTDIEKLGRQTPLSRLKSTSVQVITGKGNHSRGEAALPAAIRSFLIENGYNVFSFMLVNNHSLQLE